MAWTGSQNAQFVSWTSMCSLLTYPRDSYIVMAYVVMAFIVMAYIVVDVHVLPFDLSTGQEYSRAMCTGH